MAQRIYTRTGDLGETGLSGGIRVPKDHARIETLGDVDELNAVVGLARSQVGSADHAALLRTVQGDLLSVGADLAEPTSDAGRRVTADRVACLEREIDSLQAHLPALTSFILPGGCTAASALHVARAVCRRAERRCVALAAHEAVSPQVLAYLNRLSDLLFVLARSANELAGVADTTWP